MKGWNAFLAAAVAIALGATAAPAANELSREVRVEDLRGSHDSVQGRLVNLTDGELRDVRLLITHTFHWNDEMNPGEDNPGRSDVFVAPGPIPPHGAITFEEVVVPRLPLRADGRFVTSAEVLGFTKIGP